MSLKVCLAGVTGWAGSALAAGIFQADDLDLVVGISRNHSGKTVGAKLDIKGFDTPIVSTVAEAFSFEPEIFFEFTKPDVAKSNILMALKDGCHVVVGTSGLNDNDYHEIDIVAKEVKRGVLAVGNFALTVVLLQKFAEISAKYIPHWEIIDYADSGKVDSPSGTARELASRLGSIRDSQLDVEIENSDGPVESRGVRLNGSQVHSIRLPGYIISLDAIFGMPDQKLVLRHEAGSSAEPYVEGALLAIRNVNTLAGLHRGLDSVMEF